MNSFNSSTPLRYEIRKRILEFLINENYKPGDQIPTEPEFIELLGVSRFTVREAFHLLEAERILRTKQGSGRYLVSDPKDIHMDITRLQSVSQLLSNNGVKETIQVLSVEKMPANKDVAFHLSLEPGTPVLYIKRLRCVEGKPVIYSIDVIEAVYFKDVRDDSVFMGCLFNYLRDTWKIKLEYSWTNISAVLINESIAKETGIRTSEPWILLEEVVYNRLGKPIIYSTDYHEAKNIQFQLKRLSLD